MQPTAACIVRITAKKGQTNACLLCKPQNKATTTLNSCFKTSCYQCGGSLAPKL